MSGGITFWDYKLIRTIASVGEDQSSFAQERRRAFLFEFKEAPEAETLRIRYRFWLTVVTFSLMIADSAAHIALESMGQAVGPFGWWWGVGALSGLILHNQDNTFVRAVMKRRQVRITAQHPRLAENLLLFFLPDAQCDDVISDFNDGFEERCSLWNLRYARLWYWWQTFCSLSPMVDSMIERLIKWGTIGAIASWIRRYLEHQQH